MRGWMGWAILGAALWVGCDAGQATRGTSRGKLGKFLDGFEASAAKGEASPDDARGACADLCEGLRTCVNEACAVAVPAAHCERLCGAEPKLDRPACERIQGAVAAEPALCVPVGAIVASDAAPGPVGGEAALMPDAAPPPIRRDASPEDPGLGCNRFCSCTVEAPDSVSLQQCLDVTCTLGVPGCIACYGTYPLCAVEDLEPCQRACLCVKACGQDQACQAGCLSDPAYCGGPGGCDACRRSDPLCQ